MAALQTGMQGDYGRGTYCKRSDKRDGAKPAADSAASCFQINELSRILAESRDPAELLDAERFPTPAALTDHLFSAFIPAVYQHPPVHQPPPAEPRTTTRARRRWAANDARCWLSHLARHMNRLGTRDLAWWQLGDTVPRPTRALLGAVAFGCVFGPVFGLVGGYSAGIATALAVGLAYGLRAFGPKPVRTHLQLRGRAGWLLRDLAAGLAGGLGIGLATSLGLGVSGGLLGGLAGGLVIGLAFGLAAPVDTLTAVCPWDLLAADRRNTLFKVLVGGLVTGLVLRLAAGFAVGAAFGLAFVLAYGIAGQAWCRWVLLARVWLPLTGRLPWAVVAFLDDPHRRGVLRQAGAVYQFRHARLQERLACAPAPPTRPRPAPRCVR
jgi:hypothetical protein